MKLHLGAGGHFLDGWDNLDIEPRAEGVLACDLRGRLPYDDETVAAIWSEHFLEHLERSEFVSLLRECFRVMAPGAVIRISTPDLLVIARDYLHDKTDRWEPVGRVYATPAQLLNGAMRDDGHRFLYDARELIRVLTDAGFVKVTTADPTIGRTETMCNLESRPYCADLIVEAEKP